MYLLVVQVFVRIPSTAAPSGSIPFEAPEQYELVAPANPPAFIQATHKAAELAPLETEDGYLQQWEVVPLSDEELAPLEAEHLAAEQVARDAARVNVTKRQALLALFDMKAIKNEDIEAQIILIPDDFDRYRALVDLQGSAAIPTQGDVPTIGYGSTVYEDGTRMTLADPPISKERALQIVRDHKSKDEAMFRASSMRRHLLNGGYLQACNALPAWRKQADRDCSLPQNWVPKGCKDVWTRLLERQAKCLGEQS
ncbi:hypothetical protein [Comamonas sp. 4034]|uniref:hypothetical protein n=1 Tax=Comamonas sp. 4034 TaxID=3156455 RepID=UPI003D1B30A3